MSRMLVQRFLTAFFTVASTVSAEVNEIKDIVLIIEVFYVPVALPFNENSRELRPTLCSRV